MGGKKWKEYHVCPCLVADLPLFLCQQLVKVEEVVHGGREVGHGLGLGEVVVGGGATLRPGVLWNEKSTVACFVTRSLSG